MKRILKLIGKKTPEVFHRLEIENETKKQDEAIRKGWDKYQEDKAAGRTMERLEKQMFYRE